MTPSHTRIEAGHAIGSDIDRVAALFPHRVAHTAELARIGASTALIYQQCQRDGPWRRLLPEVILLANSPPTRSQLVRAALRYAGDGAIVTGADALRLHGIRAPDTGAVRVLVPSQHRVRGDPSVVVEHCRVLPNPVLRRGFLVAPLSRAAIDTARAMTDVVEMRTLLDEVMRRGRLGPTSLRAELDKAGRSGASPVRQVLAELADRRRAADESMARQFLRAAGLPPPRWRQALRAPNGSPLGTVDAWWPDVGMAWEIDSFAEHVTPERYARMIAKHASLIACGVLVVHSTPSRLRDDRPALADELRRSYACAGKRPTPEVLPHN